VDLRNGLAETGWQERLAFFKEHYSPCCLCPRACGAERAQGKAGVCQATDRVKIASFSPHFGEEPPISGTRGSGTVFFSGCTLKCLFCQNYPISHLFNGKYYSVAGLAGIFLQLQKQGAHNINFVSPTPYLYHIVQALHLATARGLDIPVVYNTSGYEQKDIIRHLAGLVDIYLPDYKYADNGLAQRFSGVKDCVERTHGAIEEMFDQVGELDLDDGGVARKGLIIRHLILPKQMENSKRVLARISQSRFKDAYLSLMSQYFPAFKATTNEDLCRRIEPAEYREIRDYALSLGFSRGWFQDL